MDTVISTYIDLPGMNNTRDLGGMRTKDGHRIRSGRLIRSAKLSNLEDPAWFTENVGLVVDLRSSRECSETPDPAIPGVDYLHLPIFEIQASGVTRDRESDKRLPALDPENALARMAGLYVRFVTDEFSLSQYRRFIRLLFEPREKALLWHCTAGKDRTGVAALFIQELLGVGREDIMADYTITNQYLAEEIRQLCEARARELGGMDEAQLKAMTIFMGACEEYILGVYAKAEELYGSFDGFIREGLEISDAQREELRRMYLE